MSNESTTTQVLVKTHKLMAADEVLNSDMFGMFKIVNSFNYEGELYLRHAHSPELLFSIQRTGSAHDYRDLGNENVGIRFEFMRNVTIEAE